MERIKYRREDEMKDSGIEWLGKIPKEWEVKKLKYIFESVKNGIWGDDEKGDENDVFCIRVTNFNRDKSIVEMDNLTVRNLDKYKQKDYLLKKNDLLIEKSGGGDNQPVGFVAIYNSNVPAIYANFMARIVINQKNDNRYILYYLSTLYNKRINTKHINQTTGIQNINTTSYFDEKIGIPKILEQRKIANFLDIKTSQFDSVISKKEKLIEKLEEAKKSLISEVVTGKVKIVDGKIVERKPEEMKDSGVEWLGKIPKDWEVKKLKYIASLRSGRTITNDSIEEEGRYPVYGGNGLRGYTNQYTHNGDYILIGRQGALCGNINYAQDRFWASEHAVVVNLVKDVNYIWLGELLRTMNLNQYSISAAQPGLSVGMIENLYIPYVEKRLQDEISIFLKKYLEEFGGIISRLNKQIQKLKEAKESLISEAVTGKIDLRDWEIREVNEL